MELTVIQNTIALEKFKEYLAYADIRSNSKRTYSAAFKQFMIWFDTIPVVQITRETLLAYKAYLIDAKKEPSTIGSYLTVLKNFLNYLEQKYNIRNVGKGIKVPPQVRGFKKSHLTATKVTELLASADTLRDYALFNLMVRAGLRTKEVVAINIEDIKIKSCQNVLYVHGKGRISKDKFVILTPKAYEPIKEYIESKKIFNPSDPLFISTSNRNMGKRLKTGTIRRLVKTKLRSINLDSKEFSAHALRHTAAVAIIKGGGTLNDVKDVLRHASINTTEIYTASFDEERRLENPAENFIDELY